MNLVRIACLACALGDVACGTTPATPDAATEDASIGDAGASDGPLPPSFFPPRPAAFVSTDNAPRTVQVSISGESALPDGYPYNANPGPDDAVFVDGWSLAFDRYFVVIGAARLNASPSDPSMRGNVGAIVAEARGPWLIDLRRRGPLVGAAGSPETAWPLAVLTGSLDPTTTYAFSYETAPASRAMSNVNVPETDRALVERMVARGWSILFSGTATYAGRSPTDAIDPTFRSYPTAVRFEFGWAMPARYANCHNPELGEEDTAAHRGIRPRSDGARRAQLTFHSDHFFWDQADVEGTPLRFDALAARADRSGIMNGDFSVSMDDLVGVPVSSLVDRGGASVRDRGAQTAGYTAATGAPPAYASNGIAEITDLRAFVAYNARGQGHLNSDGLCLVQPTAAFTY